MTSLERIVFVHIRDGNIVSTEDKQLTLSYENLTDMPRNLIEDYGNVIEILDLSHNRLTKVDFLVHFNKITTLILDHNFLTSDTQFPEVPSLNTLWLNHNSIDKLHPLCESLLKGFPNLKVLSLMGNVGAPSYLNGGTYYEYLRYRLFVISWLPKLEYLDDRPVTVDQREEAQRLFSRSIYQTFLNLPFPQYLQQFQQKVKYIVESITPKNVLEPNHDDEVGENVNRII